jgi:hypothetical protein
MNILDEKGPSSVLRLSLNRALLCAVNSVELAPLDELY